MDYKKRLSEIADFLQPYQRIWQNEIMLLYPNPLADFPKEWVEELASFKAPSDLLKLGVKDVQGLVKNPELLAFYARIEELAHVPEISTFPAMPENAFTFLYTIPKKQHEIRKLAPFINHFYKELGCDGIVDIGGGIGLLAQNLVNQYQLKVTSLDMDPVLQNTGKERHHKNATDPNNKVTYTTVKVGEDEKQFLELLSEKSMTIGLHTCGNLANEQIKASAKRRVKSIVNFGCCFHKIKNPKTEQNLSQYAQKLTTKLELNPYALTLASRGHKKMSEGDRDLKLKVKHYRYAMHFLLHDYYDLKEMVTLGNTTPKQYEEDFATYALEQLNRLNISPRHSREDLNTFFQDSARQTLIWNMLAAGHIRDALGRLLELYLLLDRVIYLEEMGYQTQLLEFFDETLSPRNLGISATYAAP